MGASVASKSKIAVIGAGLTGLVLARQLSGVAEVQVFEKSRGFGGRMATRRAAGFEFDHGAQFFTIRDSQFRAFLAPLLEDGTVQPWKPRLAGSDGAPSEWSDPHYVAVPGMSALGRRLATGVTVHRETRIAALRRSADRWQMLDEAEEACGEFDWVIVTAPAEQAQALIPDVFAHRQALGTARMQGCFSLMVGLDRQVDFGWDVMRPENCPLSWVACNHSKPGRPAALAIVCHAANDWSEQHLDDDPRRVKEALFKAFSHLTGITEAQAPHIDLHRWRYARTHVGAGKPFLMDDANRLAVAGDWCVGDRLEAAFQSAYAISEMIMNKGI
jgi:predicted NAD/FAD-dependent oxidoreductase